MSAATLTVRFTGEVNDLEKKAQKAKRAIEGPMKDLEKPGFWAKISGQAGKAGTDAGDKFSRNLGDRTKAGAGKLGGLMKLGLVGVAAKLGLDFGNEFMSALSGASNLEQSKGGLAAVFKKDTAELDKAAQGAAKSLGLSRNSYNELATVLGAGLKNKGLTDYADKTQDLIGLGADLSAMYGGTAADAVSAISSLMRGESDPIEKYGVSISETAISAELAAKGQDKLTGAALEQAKAQARLDILFRQTTDAQGTFAKESDTMAGKQQRAGAMWEDLKTKIGEGFLPAISGAMGWLVDKGIPGMENFGKKAGDAIGGVWDLLTKGEDTGGLLKAFGIEEDDPILTFFSDLKTTVTDAWGGIQDALKRAWVVVEPIATKIWDFMVVKWGEIAPKVEETFGTVLRIVDEVMLAAELIIEGITGNISKVWDLWGDNILTQIDIVFDTISTVFSGLATTVEGIWTTFTGILSGDWSKMADGLELVASGLGTALGGIWDGIKLGALNSFDAMVNGIGSTWDGIKSAISSPINVVIGFINDGIIGSYNWVASKLGIGTIGRIPLMKTGDSGRGSTGGRGAASAFANGGYTGDGGKWEKAGDVHAGEYVLTQEEVKLAGGWRALESKKARLLGYANGGLVRPVPQASSGWNGGRYRSGKWHGGLDFPAPVGQPIAAMWPGTVSRALSLTTSYGKHAIVDHGSGLQTLYAHMSRLAARVGQVVQAGGILGAVGSTGNSTGPHLHLEVRRNGKQLDPTGFLSGAASGPSGGFLGAIAAGFSSVKDWFGSIMDRVGGAWSTLTGSAGGGIMGQLATGIGDKLRDDLGAWVRGKLGYRSGGVAGSGLHWVGEGGQPELIDFKGGERIRTLSQLRGRGQTSQGAGMDELVDRLVEAIASREVPSVEVALVEGDIRRVVRSEVRAMGVRV